MDLGFHRRGRIASPDEQALDYRSIIADLAVTQAVCPTAMLASRLALENGEPATRDAALAILFLCEPGWVRAAAALGGSFDGVLARKFPAIRS